jgi:hypothetical protein
VRGPGVELICHEGFQQSTTLLKGPVDGDRAVRRRQNVKDDKSCRSVGGKFSDAALGGMQPHLQSIEIEPPVDLDDQLTVEDEPLCDKRGQHCHHFWKISTEWLARFGAQIDGSSSLEGETPKAIPFRFVLPGVGPSREALCRLRVHRRRFERKQKLCFLLPLRRGFAGRSSLVMVWRASDHDALLLQPFGRHVYPGQIVADLAMSLRA